MKEFFKKYSYTIFKLFLNQIAIALFGVGLAFATTKAQNTVLVMITGIGSVLFYLFLQYAVMWEVGAKDGISAVARKESRKLWRGLVITALANALNLVFALLTLLGAGAASGSVRHGIAAFGRGAALLLEGMYMGILSMDVGGVNLNTYIWPYFAIILPALLVGSVAYITGSFNLHATNILIQKNKDVKNNGRPE